MSWTHVNSTPIRESMWPMLIISTLNFPPTVIGLFNVASKSVVNVEAEVSKLGRIGEMICHWFFSGGTLLPNTTVLSFYRLELLMMLQVCRIPEFQLCGGAYKHSAHNHRNYRLCKCIDIVDHHFLEENCELLHNSATSSILKTVNTSRRQQAAGARCVERSQLTLLHST